MSFLASLFSCCTGRRSETEKSNAEARRIRIETIYAGSVQTAESIIASPPPCYADIAHDRQWVPVDEKSPRNRAVEEQQPQPLSPMVLPVVEYSVGYTTAPTHGSVPSQRRSSVSSGSSVVSVPSTRLSDLTSLRTGATRRQRPGRRDGDTNTDGDDLSEMDETWNDSAPPSYYAGSERSVTPGPGPGPIVQSSGTPQHPVMQEGWFESLRLNAERERNRRLIGDDTNPAEYGYGYRHFNERGRVS